MAEEHKEGLSLAETPTWSVATVTSVLVFVCFVVERSIFRFGKWLKRTRRKALFASLEKIKEELMLLGLISLMLGQWASWISEICVDSTLFNSKFFLCSEEDFTAYPAAKHHETKYQYYLTHVVNHVLVNASTFIKSESESGSSTGGVIPPQGLSAPSHPLHHCGEGREPFISSEGLEQLHRFLFVLGITHVFYSCLAVGLAMTKIYSWRRWETQATVDALTSNFANTTTEFNDNSQPKRNIKVMRRQSTFAFHHASHPWSRNRVLLWMLCFLRQFKSSIRKSDYMALRLGFITNHRLPNTYNFHKYMVRGMEDDFHCIVGISWPLWAYAIICMLVNIHGLNIYFWLSFVPVILVMVIGTKLEHVVSILALEEPGRAPVKPRDELFWFGKPGIMLRLIQFISFQSAFEMATFIWDLWGFKQRSCFMKNHAMVIVRLASGILVQFWCSYSTVPLTVIITQMGSKCKKALVAESVRDSLHSWCKRVKEKNKRLHAARSVCSLDTATIDERDETTTVASLTLSPCSSAASLNEVTISDDREHDVITGGTRLDHQEHPIAGISGLGHEHELSFRLSEYISQSAENSFVHPPENDEDVTIDGEERHNIEMSLLELFQKHDSDV